MKKKQEVAKEKGACSKFLIHMDSTSSRYRQHPPPDPTHLSLTFSILHYLLKYITKLNIYFHRKEFRRKNLLMGIS